MAVGLLHFILVGPLSSSNKSSLRQARMLVVLALRFRIAFCIGGNLSDEDVASLRRLTLSCGQEFYFEKIAVSEYHYSVMCSSSSVLRNIAQVFSVDASHSIIAASWPKRVSEALAFGFVHFIEGRGWRGVAPALGGDASRVRAEKSSEPEFVDVESSCSSSCERESENESGGESRGPSEKSYDNQSCSSRQ